MALGLDSQHRHPGVFHKRSLSNGMGTMQELPLSLVSLHHSTYNDTGNELGDKLHNYADKRQSITSSSISLIIIIYVLNMYSYTRT